ncbi:hypothetical protein [Pseudomonas arsenicoxydans]|uniref:Uncharacterized protein n=1 Tax=Pseudomonas arsenicoxydans TaxID=702115 RepID=A0A502HQL6_9PSED|nr:hypothetical protein [Pseudomonas arsenicoxydans]TPG75656.1 hypothetical protein EAH78_19035 [Pseudomonas arsenicoxydans]
MQKLTGNWSDTPTFCAATNMINTPTQTNSSINCWGTTPRLNIGNIHEIKKYWQRAEVPDTSSNSAT